MPGYIDFEEVKQSVKIEDAVARLGLTLTPRNNQLRGPCPVCEKGGDRALCVTPAKGKWYCFGCETGGDVIQLAAHFQGIHPKEAAHWLLGVQPEEKSNKAKPASSEGLRELDYLEHEHEAVEALGIEPSVAEVIGLGYAKRGVMRGTVAVPIRTPDGTLVGYIGLTEIAKLPPKWTL